MGWNIGVGELTKKVAQYYEELVATRVRFEELKQHTTETLGSFKEALERISDRLTSVEMKHVESQALLLAKTESISDRLNSLSEKALHAAMGEAARELLRERIDTMEQAKDKDKKYPSIPTSAP
jgi:chromosome segregation ATPase